MRSKSSLIVVTDLDGTLLDHHDYSFDAAKPALKMLVDNNIPLILNSSKTAGEIRQLRLQLNNLDPYVVENGAGIYLHDDNGDKQIDFGLKRESILLVLNTLRKEKGYQFTGFNDMSVAELMNATGLALEQAELAKERAYSEPLSWQGDEQSLADFMKLLEQHELTATQGGRFLSISGKVDKGQALNWLKKFYQKEDGGQPYVIALGDSPNDEHMLNLADQAIVVRSPVNDLPIIKKDNVIITEQDGPEGWNNTVLSLLEKLDI